MRLNPVWTCWSVALVWQLCATCVASFSDHPKLIIISFDGFRHDYVNKTDTPNFRKLASDGVRAPWIEPRFITKTIPNHYSIATGLNEESHGMVANIFYDPEMKKAFNISDQNDSKFWEMAVPLWVTNHLADTTRHSGGMMWPGTNVVIHEVLPAHYQSYNTSLTWNERVDEAVSWFTDKDSPINLLYMYFEEPDSAGHKFGPDSAEVAKEIRRADEVMGYLVHQLSKAGLYDRVNLIITSDHGMTNTPRGNFINMTEILDSKYYSAYGSSPVWNILPNSGDEDIVYETFFNASKTMNFTVYKKDDIPDSYHYKNNRRILPILLVANENWTISSRTDDLRGNHGYNNSLEAMRPFFIAHGPDFKKGYLSQPFRNIDIYPLACHLLGLNPLPNNASLDNVKDLLRYPPSQSIDNILLTVVATLLVVCLLLALITTFVMLARIRSRSTVNSVSRSGNSDEEEHLIDAFRRSDGI